MRISHSFWLSTALLVMAAPGCGTTQTQPAVPAAEEPDTGATESAAETATDSSVEEESPAEDAASGEQGESQESSKPSARRDAIVKVVKDNRQKIRDCYDAALKENPDLKGDLVIHFKVDAEGKVAAAELVDGRSQITEPKVVDCAIAALKGLTFPPHADGMDTEVNYPFNLNPK